jgi:hypothetical protein
MFRWNILKTFMTCLCYQGAIALLPFWSWNIYNP